MQVRREGGRPQQWRCIVVLPRGSGRGVTSDVVLRAVPSQPPPAKRRRVAPAESAPPPERQFEWQRMGGPAAAALSRAACTDIVG